MKDFKSTGMSARSVELYIDELVLHGFSPTDRNVIAAAVEHELTRLLSAQFAPGVPESFAHNSEHERVDAGAFNIAQGANSNSIGSQIAQTVYHGLFK